VQGIQGLVLLLLLLALGGGGLWWLWGSGPRCWRAQRRVRQQLAAGDWQKALDTVQQLAERPWSSRQRRQVQELQAACYLAASQACLTARQFDTALTYGLQAARLRGQDEGPVRRRVAAAMLAQARLLFTAPPALSRDAAVQLLQEVLRLWPDCAEAPFWLGLCALHAGQGEEARRWLQAAAQAAPPAKDQTPLPPDPCWYLGGICLRQGQPREALRWLTEANRRAENNPFILALLGVALIEAQADVRIAVRTLQRSLGSQGREAGRAACARAWRQGWPSTSYVSGLAAEHPFVCPLWGENGLELWRVARLALGEGLLRLGQDSAAAEVFQQLLDEGALSRPVLRGLGLALARQERYDQAFKHLRAAYELQPEDPWVAGYLALCAARGKPLRPEDRPHNLAWAVGLLTQYPPQQNEEWLALVRAVFREAQTSGVSATETQQRYLCDLLAAHRVTDPEAAEAYLQLYHQDPDHFPARYAWLYCRAAAQHGLDSAAALALFARTFAEEAEARAFYAAQGWDFEEVSYYYLALAAEHAPGQFPAALGPEAQRRGAALLWQRSRQQEAAGQLVAARQTLRVLQRLAPTDAHATEELARLSYRLGEENEALAVLQTWARQDENNPLPWLRQAGIYFQQAQRAAGCEALRQALRRCSGRQQALVALAGARLLIASCLRHQDYLALQTDLGASALAWLEDCLRQEPGQPEAWLWSAALRALRHDWEGLAAQAPTRDTDETNPYFHFLAALCHLAAGNEAALQAACARVHGEAVLEKEKDYLLALFHGRRQDWDKARPFLERLARQEGSPSCALARALLGQLHYFQGAYASAASWWQHVTPAQRQHWQLDRPLAGSLFLAGLEALHQGRSPDAVRCWRQCQQLGWPEAQRLTPLLARALFQAGVQLLGKDPALSEESARQALAFLQEAQQQGFADPQLPYALALAHKRLGQWGALRAILRRAPAAEGDVTLQEGLAAFAEGQYAQAEEAFHRACQEAPQAYVPAYNLFVARLFQGKGIVCWEQLPQLFSLAPHAAERRFLQLLADLLQRALRPTLPTLPLPADAWEGDGTGAAAQCAPALADLETMTADEEQRLLLLMARLEAAEWAQRLWEVLATACPDRPAVRTARLEAALYRGSDWVARGYGAQALNILLPLYSVLSESSDSPGSLSPNQRAAYWTCLGLSAVLTQDWSLAAQAFQAALRESNHDPWLHQNLALVLEIRQDLEKARSHWEQYLSSLASSLPVPEAPDYRRALEVAVRRHVAEMCLTSQRGDLALSHLQRARALEPHNTDILERLFQVARQQQQIPLAQQALVDLRSLRPTDPLVQVYDLELRALGGVRDLGQVVAELTHLLTQYPNQPRLAEQATQLLAQVLARMQHWARQQQRRLERLLRQTRHAGSYRTDWEVVRQEAYHLYREFRQLLHLAQKCFPLITDEEQRQTCQELCDWLARRINTCRSLQEWE
jgi:Flp pilus assembly protein TadD/TolA-binding protein